MHNWFHQILLSTHDMPGMIPDCPCVSVPHCGPSYQSFRDLLSQEVWDHCWHLLTARSSFLHGSKHLLKQLLDTMENIKRNKMVFHVLNFYFCQNIGSQPRTVLIPVNIWQHLETFLIETSGDGMLPSSWWRPWMLSPLHCTGQLPHSNKTADPKRQSTEVRRFWAKETSHAY